MSCFSQERCVHRNKCIMKPIVDDPLVSQHNQWMAEVDRPDPTHC
jgi:hypothetical protein